MSIWKNIFGKKEKANTFENYAFDLTDTEKKAIEDFSHLDADNRIRQIMILGDLGDFQNFALMRFAILSDPDLNVKFAGLKRIHAFKEHPELSQMIIKMQQEKIGEKMEPYFSMTLNRLGLITIEEFEKKVNNRRHKDLKNSFL